MKDYLRLIDTQTVGGRHDVTPLFANADAFRQVIADLYRPFRHEKVTHVAGVDALGFIIGAALATLAQAGFVALRKGGKLPLSSASLVQTEFVDYTGTWRTLQLRRDALPSGAGVLVVDDLVETGAQLKAAIALLEKQGAKVVGVAAVAMSVNEATSELSLNYRCHTVWSGE